jgi:hypothetical protein
MPIQYRGLEYIMCEDWFIYAKDKDGKLYYVNTELWPEWKDIANQQGKDIGDVWQEKDAIEKYMLPIAKKKWNNLNWHKTEYSASDLTNEAKTISKKLRKKANLYNGFNGKNGYVEVYKNPTESEFNDVKKSDPYNTIRGMITLDKTIYIWMGSCLMDEVVKQYPQLPKGKEINPKFYGDLQGIKTAKFKKNKIAEAKVDVKYIDEDMTGIMDTVASKFGDKIESISGTVGCLYMDVYITTKYYGRIRLGYKTKWPRYPDLIQVIGMQSGEVVEIKLDDITDAESFANMVKWACGELINELNSDEN